MGHDVPPLANDQLRQLVEKERSRRAAEKSLYEFVRQGWHVLEPGTDFIPSWHIQIICEHLEAVSRGEIRRLLINIPPRHAKSLIAVMWTVWEWVSKPWTKFLCSSYSGKLSIRDNLKARRLLDSPWFKERWGDKFVMTSDQNEKGRFENSQTGYRIATSTNGSSLGEGGDILLNDDPHGISDANSDVQRATTLQWFDLGWSTRLNNPKKSAMVVIMQRLHEGDVSGHILNDLGGWEHLCIPAEYDGVRRRTSRGEYDPRTTLGELICPERFGPVEIKALKLTLGKAGAAGQLQQTPTPGDGGVLDVRQFRLWPAAAPMPQIRFVIQSYDGAYTEDTLNDPTACTVWGVFGHDKVNHIMLLDAWDEHLAYPELRKRVMQDWKAEYGGTQKGGTLTTAVKVSRVLVEDKSSGISLLQDLRRARVPVAAYNPGNASKVQRAHLASPVLDAGLIWIPESSSAPGKPVSWAEKMIDQLKKFPLADHDDLVDSTTAAIIYLKNEGFIELPTVEADPHDDVPTKRLVNPYAA